MDDMKDDIVKQLLGPDDALSDHRDLEVAPSPNGRIAPRRGTPKAPVGPIVMRPFEEVPDHAKPMMQPFYDAGFPFLSLGSTILVPNGPLMGVWNRLKGQRNMTFRAGQQAIPIPGRVGRWYRERAIKLSGRAWSKAVMHYCPQGDLQRVLATDQIQRHAGLQPTDVEVRKSSGGLAYTLMRQFYDAMDPMVLKDLRRRVWKASKAAPAEIREPFIFMDWMNEQVVRAILGPRFDTIWKWHRNMITEVLTTATPRRVMNAHKAALANKPLAAILCAALDVPRWYVTRLLRIPDNVRVVQSPVRSWHQLLRAAEFCPKNPGHAVDLTKECDLMNRNLDDAGRQMEQYQATKDSVVLTTIRRAIARMGYWSDFPHAVPDAIRMAIALGRVRQHPQNWDETAWTAWHDDLAAAHRTVLRTKQDQRLRGLRLPKSRFLSVEGVDLISGWSWRQLLWGDEVLEEGERQHHCVGSYVTTAEHGQLSIFQVLGPRPEERYTLALNERDGSILDFAGLQNKNPSRQAFGWADKWLPNPNHWRRAGAVYANRNLLALQLWRPPDPK